MPGLHDVTTRGGPMAHGADLAWVADALVERREDILSRWRDVTTHQPFHMGRRSLAVADHIPDLFDAIVALLQRTAAPAILSESPLLDPAVLDAAREHARVRFEQGLSAADVVTEFRLLRQELGRAIRGEVDDAAPTGDVVAATLLVHDALDGAIALALAALSVHLDDMRDEFLATTVHDVQQPITALKGYVQLTILQLDRPSFRRPEGRRSLAAGRCRDQPHVAAAQNIVGRIAFEARASRARLADADLGAILREHLDRLGPDAIDRVHVEQPGDADLTGFWDPDLLERVIGNLVSNALKYSPPEQSVEVTVTSNLESVKLSVADHGIGISEAELPSLFTRDGRTASAVTAGIEGHGLGLFQCKGIVDAHGGRIWAESPGADRGTTVLMVLPRISRLQAAD
jgi:signal transduction histidine kinase